MDPDLEARIRERAYALWVQDGRGHGQADDYWYRAEREIRSEDGDALSHDAAEASVFAVPDSEMLTGEPDQGKSPGGPTVAAMGVAPAAPEKAGRTAARRGAATGKATGAPHETAAVETAAEGASAKQALKAAGSRAGGKRTPKAK